MRVIGLLPLLPLANAVYPTVKYVWPSCGSASYDVASGTQAACSGPLPCAAPGNTQQECNADIAAPASGLYAWVYSFATPDCSGNPITAYVSKSGICYNKILYECNGTHVLKSDCGQQPPALTSTNLYHICDQQTSTMSQCREITTNPPTDKTASPTPRPTAGQTAAPTVERTSAPTDKTAAPTDKTASPTPRPTTGQTAAPTVERTSAPTDKTAAPTDKTAAPTDQGITPRPTPDSSTQTRSPTPRMAPTDQTKPPTDKPTVDGQTRSPTPRMAPTDQTKPPTDKPTPDGAPTAQTRFPTEQTKSPSSQPTTDAKPTPRPTADTRAPTTDEISASMIAGPSLLFVGWLLM